MQGPWKFRGIYFFNSTAGELFLGMTVLQKLGASAAMQPTGLLELETSGFQANPKPWSNLSGRWLQCYLEFVPSRVSLEADGWVLLQALHPGSEYQSSRSPRQNRDQAANRTARASPASLGCNASSESDRCGARLTDWCWVTLCCMCVLGSCWLLLTLMSWSLPLHNARSWRMWLSGQDIVFCGMQTHTCICADVKHITSSY